jgi:hypothetical protein
VHDIDRAEQDLHRLVDRQVQVVGFNHNVVVRIAIVRIQTQGIAWTHVLGI